MSATLPDDPIDPDPLDPEDEAFLRAIREGESAERVGREAVFEYLNRCAGQGDYTAERAAIFAGLSVDDIITEIERERGQAASRPAPQQ